MKGRPPHGSSASSDFQLIDDIDMQSNVAASENPTVEVKMTTAQCWEKIQVAEEHANVLAAQIVFQTGPQ